VTSNYFGGNHVTQHGDHSIGMINNNAPADPQATLQEMINAVHALRGQVSPADRQVIDESMSTIGAGANVEPQRLRRALGNLAGIATVVGQVGAPVVEAVRKMMTAFGL
jgi:hypothetical protein